MTPEERADFFRQFGRSRMARLMARRMVVLVVLAVGAVYVLVEAAGAP